MKVAIQPMIKRTVERTSEIEATIQFPPTKMAELGHVPPGFSVANISQRVAVLDRRDDIIDPHVVRMTSNVLLNGLRTLTCKVHVQPSYLEKTGSILTWV